MRSSPGRWVQGNDFFGREAELALLSERVADGNHVLLTGQRRMGKTSLARELGRRRSGHPRRPDLPGPRSPRSTSRYA